MAAGRPEDSVRPAAWAGKAAINEAPISAMARAFAMVMPGVLLKGIRVMQRNYVATSYGTVARFGYLRRNLSADYYV